MIQMSTSTEMRVTLKGSMLRGEITALRGVGLFELVLAKAWGGSRV